MKLSRALILGLISWTLNTAQIAYATPNSTITYKNQRGSTLVLAFHSGKQKDTGTLSGTFTTAVGNCEADMHLPLPILGYYNGNAVTITVNFPHCKQVVAMTGNISTDKRKLHTLWLDAAPASDPQGSDWNSNIVGSDSYERMR